MVRLFLSRSRKLKFYLTEIKSIKLYSNYPPGRGRRQRRSGGRTRGQAVVRAVRGVGGAQPVRRARPLAHAHRQEPQERGHQEGPDAQLRRDLLRR